ncbi:WD repeat-containing protein 7-like [Tubulanus polymorphus]|uniref:WD repeat-containing protein 7-like n=1 Tax=Tubulanus polymorphus TaxID=672921 RepID=UPI003DA22CE8
MSASNLVVPIVLWGKSPPTHCISAIMMTQDERHIITGCNDGQICIWDLTHDWKVFPRSLLFGHSAAISCLSKASNQIDKQYIVSSSENGEMCLWDIRDGRCIEYTKMSITHTQVQAYQLMLSKDVRLVTNGYYPEIHVIDPLSFEILISLVSKVQPDWITALCILRPVNRSDDVVVAISNSGAVKCWTLMASEIKARYVNEDESKQIRCLNAHTLRCCAYNQRTVLIVCSKYWQIYDAGDFSLLCSESNPCGERWMGGEFLSVDQVIVWSNEGKGYLYKLPINILKGRAIENDSAISQNPEFHHNVGPNRTHSNIPHAYSVLNVYVDKPLSCPPAMAYFMGTRERHRQVLIRGDSEGRLVVWEIPKVSEKQMKLVRQESFDRLPVKQSKVNVTLSEAWEHLDEPSSGIIDDITAAQGIVSEITATVYIPSQGKLVCGRANGSIVIVPATQSAIIQLLDSGQTIQTGTSLFRVLKGHHGKVTCLLYPFNDSTRYEHQHLLSGGIDFTVILWDIYTRTKLHTFTNHGGEITQLLVPPPNCNNRVLTSVCSVASDHSVALLSLRERKCIMLAARQLFPVQTIKWRPLDDFIVIGCTDGTVYVWQMETGHLDRVVQGITAEEILAACDELLGERAPVTTGPATNENLANPHISIAQAFRRRNLATFKNLAQQRLQHLSNKNVATNTHTDNSVKPQAFPMMIQGIRSNRKDPDAHVLLFDTEGLIVQLLSNEYATMSPGTLESHGFIITQETQDASKADTSSQDPQQKLAGFIAKVKDKAETMQQKIQAKNEHQQQHARYPTPGQKNKAVPNQHQKPRTVSLTDNHSLTMEIAQILMSCLHAWNLDPDLDKLCYSKLGLMRPRCPISFGLLSRGGHMSLLLPGWQRRLGQLVISQKESPLKQTSIQLLDPDPVIDLSADNHVDGTLSQDCESSESSPTASTKGHWQISSAVTTQHLLSVISVANTLMSMSKCTFAKPKSKIDLLRRRRSSVDVKSLIASLNPQLVQCMDSGSIMVSEYYSSSETNSDEENDGVIGVGNQAQIKQGWSLLAALHCVLLPDIIGEGQYKPPLLEMLARRWQHRCLEIREAAQALLLAELRRIGSKGRQSVVEQWSPSLPMYVDPTMTAASDHTHSSSSHSSRSDLHHHHDDAEDDDDDNMLMGDSPIQHKTSTSFESRRKQATAIVMMGVIGAEFGQEIQPSRRRSDDSSKKKVVEGFGIKNYSLARHTSKALTFLLLQPPSLKLPAHTPIRRAAIDLIGRGFTVWEPYIDVSAVLLGLLELCIDGDKLVPSMTFGLPLSPAADACRTARHALSLIATARPPAFVITMAKEVARYNSLAANAHQSQYSNLNALVLVRAKPEILRIIELLIEKMPNDIIDLLIETMDVVLHCLDSNVVKMNGLNESFPSISRFSMISYDPNGRRVCVGSKIGSLAFFELKHLKCQTLQGHSGAVTAVTFSPDGKYLTSYSHVDNKIMFWQNASTSVFSLGQSQTKCIKACPTPPCNVTASTNILKLVKLAWLDNRTVVLWTADGTETKFRV